MFLPHPLVKLSIMGSLCDRGSVLGLRPPGFEFRIWRAVSSNSSHYPQEILLAQFSLYVHKRGLKPDSSISIYAAWMDAPPPNLLSRIRIKSQKRVYTWPGAQKVDTSAVSGVTMVTSQTAA